MTDTIVMNGISKIYNVGGEEVRALDNASLRIAQGEFVSVVGPSGSGKSTLMNIIGCLDIADEGEYLLDGQYIQSYSEDHLAKVRNKKIGFIFQGFNLLPKMTAEENVELPLIYQRLTYYERKERVKEVLDMVGLTSRAQHRPSELSGGQQQRVAIARALATHPSLLLADEPTGNLDSKTSSDIMKLFSSLHDKGNTIVVITHDHDIARKAKRTVRILDGRVYEEAV
ncbi:MAG TPA: ABC transporter ATP-binding protein [Clostridia bacterium]|nr:ABC transporter ATP-binding protein [Clostridia bacterium]